MAKVIVYTTTFCPFCVRAMSLLKGAKIEFEEINLTGKDDELKALKEKTQFMAVPQIFINDTMIGGFQELSSLKKSGELLEMTKD